MFDVLKLLTNADYRGQAISFIGERVLPVLLGLLILIIGVAFVLAGSKTGKIVAGVSELVATKGASLVK